MVLNTLHSSEVKLPETVKASVNARKIVVTGPLGTLKREFKHAQVLIRKFTNEKGVSRIRVGVWSGDRKHRAVVQTILSQIKSLIKGVQYGYKFEMKFVYAHFPINCNISKDKKQIEIRNYIGSRMPIVTRMLHGVTVDRAEEKDTIVIQGIDLALVSLSAAQIQQKCQVTDKDTRKFLDGVYVSSRQTMLEED
eukprot:TRINITY_DN7255_c0_g1_i1.p1 TRINITY_DN7255_c0_g1~~TRINITY_DN7255_c0_g1_i1.p1  ORF type:complete len:194 (-),score=30.80 TRINITY_DN7255_c0_g1_i1:7-588(-)